MGAGILLALVSKRANANSCTMVETFAGSVQYSNGDDGDGGQATSAKFTNPRGLWMSNNSDLWIADTYRRKVRKVDTSGIISAAVGEGTQQTGGNGLPSTDPSVGLVPDSLCADTNGVVYVVASFNVGIRKVGTDNIISQFAGIPDDR